MRYAQAPDTQYNDDSPNAQDLASQPKTFKIDSAYTLSHVQHINMPDELSNEMEEHVFVSCLNMNYNSSEDYGKEINITVISVPAAQLHVMSPIKLCIDTVIPI